MTQPSCKKKGRKAGWGLGRRSRSQRRREKAESWVTEEEVHRRHLQLKWAGGREQLLLRREMIFQPTLERRDGGQKKMDCSKTLSGVGSRAGNTGGNWVTGQGGRQSCGAEEQVCSGGGLRVPRGQKECGNKRSSERWRGPVERRQGTLLP